MEPIGIVMIGSVLAGMIFPVWLFILLVKWIRLAGNQLRRWFILLVNIAFGFLYSFYFSYEMQHYYFYIDVGVMDFGELALAILWLIVFDLHALLFIFFIRDSIRKFRLTSTPSTNLNL